MKYFLSILMFLVLSGIVVGLNQKKELQQLEMDSNSLTIASEKVESLKAENAKLRQLEVDSEELERLRKHTEELLRLRGEVSKLRSVEDVVPEQLQSEAALLRLQAHRERERAEHLEAVIDFRNLSEERSESFGTMADIIGTLARNNNDNFPRSIKEIETGLHLFGTQFPDVSNLKVRFETMSQDGKLGNFEFISLPPGAVPGERGFPIFKEKNPIQTPDREWQRFYSFSEKLMLRVTLPENNFDEWERENFQ